MAESTMLSRLKVGKRETCVVNAVKMMDELLAYFELVHFSITTETKDCTYIARLYKENEPDVIFTGAFHSLEDLMLQVAEEFLTYAEAQR